MTAKVSSENWKAGNFAPSGGFLPSKRGQTHRESAAGHDGIGRRHLNESTRTKKVSQAIFSLLINSVRNNYTIQALWNKAQRAYSVSENLHFGWVMFLSPLRLLGL